MLRAKSRNHWAKYVMAIDSAQYTMEYVLYYGVVKCVLSAYYGFHYRTCFAVEKNATNYSPVHKLLLTG